MKTPTIRSTFSVLAVPLCLGLGMTVLTGCMDAPQVTRADSDPIGPLADPATVDAQSGTCYARATTPAIIETVTEQVMVQPAVVRSDGSVDAPAAFRTVTRQQILRERREVEFETPCASLMTPQFVASVQRALIARGYYRGSINGTLDGRTTAAIERFQTAQHDVHTGTLTLKTAQILGLVALPPDQL
ncbi:MAG: peptidoglycan-binding protein [Octadecabacter sp.]|nr:peptidoglycan-binding protein [Octadecabacter sp.]